MIPATALCVTPVASHYVHLLVHCGAFMLPKDLQPKCLRRKGRCQERKSWYKTSSTLPVLAK